MYIVPIIRRGVPSDLPNDVTFAEELLATVRAVLKHSACPECRMDCTAWGSHGLSAIHVGDDCHLGQLISIADAGGF